MKRKQLARIDLSDPKNPKINFNSLDAFRDDLRQFKQDERIWITVERYYRKRTTEQNNVLHWYLQEISDETGMEMLDVKEQMARKYLTVELKDNNDEIRVDPETGEVMTRVMSTTELNTVSFNEYTEKIRLWANEYLNMSLPLPNEEPELKFTDK